MSKIPIPPPPEDDKPKKKNIPPPPVPKDTQFLQIRRDKDKIEIASPRLPPQAIDMENAVLGALLLIPDSANEVMDILEPEVFYKEANRTVFRSIKGLYDNRDPIDILTVANELKRLNLLDNVGGNYYLIELSRSVESSAHIEYHTRIILQKYMLRELIRYSDHMIQDAYSHNPDSLHLVERMENHMKMIRSVAIRKQNKQNDSEDASKELMEKMRKVQSGEVSGNLTHIREFDEWSGGFQPRELITFAARPGQGKTTIGISMSWNAAHNKKEPVAFFSLEMSSIDIKNRIASRITKIPYSSINRGNTTIEEWALVDQAFKLIDESPIRILDTREHGNRHHNIVDKIRELNLLGYRMFYIDYIQLSRLSNSTKDDTADLRQITRDLKQLAVELNIAIVQFAQLDRRVDDRPSKMPYLRDLKQSGSLEEDSDTVIFLVRKAYYELLEKPGLELPESEIGKTDFIVAKGRNIGVRSFKVFLDFINYDAVSYSDKYF